MTDLLDRGAMVLLHGSSRVRVAGLAVHERNRRVAARFGLPTCTEIPSGHSGWILLVPADVAIEAKLLASLAGLAGPARLAGGGGAVIWGPATIVQERLAGRSDLALEDIAVVPGALFSARSGAEARSATRQILRSTGKPTDGPVARSINRPISRTCSFMFLLLGLSPGLVSVLNLAIGLFAAWEVAQPYWFDLALGGVLFQLASILDGSDGEMARASLAETAAGAEIDTAVDNLTYFFCLGGFMVGWLREGMTVTDQALAIAVALGVPLTVWRGWRFLREHEAGASFVFIDACVRRIGNRSPSFPLRLAALFFVITRRDTFSVMLMVLALAGSREAIFSLIAAGLLLGNYVLLFHRGALDSAAAELKPV